MESAEVTKLADVRVEWLQRQQHTVNAHKHTMLVVHNILIFTVVSFVSLRCTEMQGSTTDDAALNLSSLFHVAKQHFGYVQVGHRTCELVLLYFTVLLHIKHHMARLDKHIRTICQALVR